MHSPEINSYINGKGRKVTQQRWEELTSGAGTIKYPFYFKAYPHLSQT